MLRIRFQRKGKQDQAHFKVVVQEHTSHVSKKAVETVGWYDPISKGVEVDKDKVTEWIKKGAKPSSTVARFLKKQGLNDMEQYIKTKKIKTKAELAAEAKKEAESKSETESAAPETAA